MNSIRQGLLAVTACAFLLIITGAAVVFGIYRTNELADQQEYVGDKLFAARQVFETVLSMESSQRGFLVTGDVSYLEPYLHETTNLVGNIATFERLYRDDSDAGEMVATIHHLAQTKQAELAQTVALARDGRLDAALEIVKGNQGKQVMDELGPKLLALVAQQRAARTRLVDEGRATLRYIYLLGCGVAILVLALVSIAVRSLSVSIARLDDAQKAEEHNAMHDALTGLPNRRYLSEWLTTALAGAQRNGREVQVLYFDLDGFKAVNDRFGHEAGDTVLKVTASRLRGTLRASDFVARIGGDEFVAALPETEDAAALGALIERIEQYLNVAPIAELEDGVVTASIGSASFPRDGSTVTALLAAADRSMYNAKKMRSAVRSRSSGNRFEQRQPA